MKREEDLIQAEFHKWLYKNYPELRLIAYHIPNEQTRSHISGLVAMGLVSGVPDYHIAVSRCGFNSMYIEFKKPGGTVSQNQKNVQQRLLSNNNYVVNVFSFDEAVEHFKAYYEEKVKREIPV